MRRKQGREVVYVERGGDSSAKWLFWGALLGAGLALLYAPRSGEETRRVLQRKLWKLRAMTEEKLDELAQQFGAGKEPLAELRRRGRGGRVRRAPAARGRGRLRRRRPAGGARAPAGRVAGPPPGLRGPRGAARLRRSPGGWHRSPAGFLRRTLQAADENNIPFLASALTFDALLAAIPFILLLLIGLTHLAQAMAAAGRHRRPDRAVPPFLPAPRLDPGSRSVRASSRGSWCG